MTAPLRVLSLGAGYFAGFHLDGWARLPDVRVVGLADPDAGKARAAAAAAFGAAAPPVQADALALLEATPADIVDIATPPDTHLPLIRAALAARPRLVICQKPFCGGLAGARATVAEAAAAGVPLAVHENFRFQPWYRRIREILDAGTLGALYQVTFRLRPGDGQGPEAYLSRQPYFQAMPRFLVHETGVHWLDVFRFLMGPPDRVWADLRRLNPAIAGEDAGLIVLGHDDGRRALFDGNRLADHPAANPRLTMGECLVEAERGQLRLDGDGRLWHRAPGGDWAALDFEAPQEGFGGDCVRAFQAHAVAHLRDGAPLETAASDYLAVMETVEAVYRAAETGATQRLTAPRA